MVRRVAPLLALAFPLVLAGCPDDAVKSRGAAPASTASATAAGPASATPSARARPPADGAFGSGVVAGVVRFTGTPPEMKVPTKRAAAEGCQEKAIVHNAVVVTDGKLKDALVRLAPKTVPGRYDPPPTPADLDQVDCVYVPRLQGVVEGQEIRIKNSDAVMHSVHPYREQGSWFHVAQPGKGEPLVRAIEASGVIKFACDVHAWMRAFVVASPHPFFAVSAADGTFSIGRVPPGKYEVEAFHPRYGWKPAGPVAVTAEAPNPPAITVTFDEKDPPPEINKDETDGL